MKGVVLAGGKGTRIAHLTEGRNKQAYPIEGRPMISYPLETLAAMGCKDLVVVTNDIGIDDIQSVVGDGGQFGFDSAKYVLQPEPRGMADALNQAAGHVEGVFPVICGDVFFDPPPQPVTEPTLFLHDFELGHRHIVYDQETGRLGQDATGALGRNAIVLYAFDEGIFDFIPRIRQSANGEVEFGDIYRHYIFDRQVPLVQYEGFFGDMGTPEGIARIKAHLQAKQSEQS